MLCDILCILFFFLMLFLTHESNELLMVYKSGSRIMTGLEKVLGVFAYRIMELNVRVNIHVVYRIILLFLLVILFLLLLLVIL